MKNSKVYILLFVFILSFLGGVTFYFYNTMDFKDRSSLETVPTNSAIAILNSKELNHFVNLLNDSSLLLKEIVDVVSVRKHIQPLKELVLKIQTFKDTAVTTGFLQRQFLLTIHSNADNSLSALYSFKLKNRSEKRVILSIFSSSLKEEIFNSIQVFNIAEEHSTQTLYYYLYDGFLVISSNKNLLKSSITQLSLPQTSLLVDDEFSKILNVSRNINFDNLFLKLDRLSLFGNSIYKRITPHLTTNTGKWAEYDVDIKKDLILLNGIILGNKKGSKLIDFLDNNSANLTLDKVYPAYVTTLTNYSFNETLFLNRYRSFLKGNDSTTTSNLHLNIDSLVEPIQNLMSGEFGLASNYFSNDTLFIVKLKSFSDAQKVFLSANASKDIGVIELEKWKVDNSLTISIYSGLSDIFIQYLFSSFFERLPHRYLIFFDEYLVISNDIDNLKLFYNTYLTNNTLANSKSFVDYRNNFSSVENLFLYSKTQPLDVYLSDTQMTSQTNSSYLLGSQLVVDKGSFFSSLVLKRTPFTPNNERVEWKCTLDSSIQSLFSVVLNPLTNESLFLIQDLNYNLYLINTKGRIIWKRPIEEVIEGDIIQLSINQKLQNALIFNTKSRLFQINFDGNSIGNYPVILPSNSASSLSLFDYDKNGDYRLFIPCIDQRIRVYDKKGNLVVGFDADRLEGDIIETVQHFTVSDKDYILLSDQFSNRILDRKGKRRIDVKEDFKRGNHSGYYHLIENGKDYFVTSSSKGEVIKIDVPTGTVTRLNAISNEVEHYFFIVKMRNNEIGYLFASEKKISLFSNGGLLLYSKSLPIGVLNSPRLIKNSNVNESLSFIDTVNHQVYLLDILTGQIQSGFPISGHTDYQILFPFESQMKFLTGGDDNSLMLYNNYSYKENISLKFE